jgi:hypothetical protein
MSGFCSLCGLEEHFKKLKPIDDSEINVEMKLREAFKVELNDTKMSQICNQCEVNLEVSWHFYLQFVDALEIMKSNDVKQEPVDLNETIVKVEFEPVYADLFEDFKSESFSEGQDDIKVEDSMDDILPKRLGQRISKQQKPEKLSNKPGFKLPKVKATRLPKSKVVTSLEPPKFPEPLKATDKPRKKCRAYKKKGEVGYRSSDARGIRKRKEKIRFSMFDVFDEEITNNNYVAEPEVLEDLGENSRLWSSYNWSCNECETNFENIFDLNQHLHNWHKKKHEATCIECHKETLHYSAFLNHAIEGHHANLKFCCVICSEHHQSLLDIYKHQQEKHPTHKIMFCLYCGLHFFSGSSLKSHAFLKHNRIDKSLATRSNFQCDYCGFLAPIKSRMFSHVQKHRERNIHCDQW